jgi:hypothetical protein
MAHDGADGAPGEAAGYWGVGGWVRYWAVRLVELNGMKYEVDII